jgi:hypothetical protein
VSRGLHAAGVAELVDALDLGSSGENRGGSSPSARTNLSVAKKTARRRFEGCQGAVPLNRRKKRI